MLMYIYWTFPEEYILEEQEICELHLKIYTGVNIYIYIYKILTKLKYTYSSKYVVENPQKCCRLPRNFIETTI